MVRIRNSEFTDLDLGGQLIMGPPDPDLQNLKMHGFEGLRPVWALGGWLTANNPQTELLSVNWPIAYIHTERPQSLLRSYRLRPLKS